MKYLITAMLISVMLIGNGQILDSIKSPLLGMPIGSLPSHYTTPKDDTTRWLFICADTSSGQSGGFIWIKGITINRYKSYFEKESVLLNEDFTQIDKKYFIVIGVKRNKGQLQYIY